MILSKAQATAVYNAMCALNDVNGKIHARMYTGDASGVAVRESNTGSVVVQSEFLFEIYKDQNAFALAYEL